MAYCCHECFTESLIRSFIKARGEGGECEFCAATGVAILDTEQVGDFVRAGLVRAYEHVEAAGVYWDSEEHSYTAGEDAVSVLLNEGIFSDRVLAANKEYELAQTLLQDSGPSHHDIADGADDWLDGGDALLVPRNEFYGPDHNTFTSSWRMFKARVRHHARFFDLPDDDSREALLGPVASFFPKLETKVKKGTELFRARIAECELPTKAWDLQCALGPPPLKAARHNRMSPAGISYMYLGSNAITCVSEVKPNVEQEVWVAVFETRETLRILDFTVLPEISIPSIFSDDYDHNLRWARTFFRAFLAEISQPALPTADSLEYLPTQVLAEFVRSQGFHGLRFKSSQRPNGVNYTLFCSPGHDDTSDYWPKYPLFHKWLRLRRVEVLKVNAVAFRTRVGQARAIEEKELVDPDQSSDF